MSSCRKTPIFLAAVAALLLGTPAVAAGRDCTGEMSLKDQPTIEAGKVASADAKTFFIKSEMDDKACPSDTKTCRRKAFLVPGNAVLVSGHAGEFVCATFVNAKGVDTTGWLPKGAVSVDAADDATPWPGTWIRDEAKITIKDGGKGNLAVKGDATFGMHDPDKVKRGGVNMGEIAAKVTPAGARLSFAMGVDDKTLPVDKGDDTTCKVWMQRAGDYLVVDDNNACGGMNVSFRGVYSRR